MKTTVKLYSYLFIGFIWAYSCTPDYYSEPRVILLSVVETTPAIDITSTEATVGVYVISNGNSVITERGIVYNTTQNPTIWDNKVKYSTLSGMGNWAVTLKGLTPGTTYYARAYAINSMGISYGSDETFSCCPPNTLPTIFTNAPEFWGPTLISISGGVIAHGSGMVTECGFVYATTQNPTVSDTKVIIDFEFEPDFKWFDDYIYGPILGLTYYVRAYAINSVGIVYGNQESFIL